MKKYRILGVLLAVALLISLSSTTAFAFDGTVATVNAQEIPTENLVIDDFEDCESESIWSQEFLGTILNSNEQVDSLKINSTVSFSTNISSTDVVFSIKDDSDFIIKGKVVDGTKEYDINEYYDFSSTSKYHVAEWAYSADLISENEKIDCFCDLILARNFKNIDCLEGVFDSIQQYQLNNELSSELNEKIEEIFSVPFDNASDGSTISTLSISNEKEYSSANFTIHYDSSWTTNSVAQSVAEYFEQIRTAYINLGFKTPKLQSFKSTYHVHLDPHSDPNGTAAATTVKSTSLTNTCASYIIIYNFSSLTMNIQERIVHEYFHAIQNAYNKQSSWFKEACANWGKIIVGGSSTTCNGQINTFITGSTSMPETDGYGAVMFPLTIHRRYGGANAILSIYEKYNDYGASISQSKLRNVITSGIQNTGTTEGFGAAYRAMASYLYSTSTWYSSVYSGASNWRNAPINTHTTSITSQTSEYSTSTSFSGSLAYLTNEYYQLSLPANFKGAVKIVVDYSGSNGYTQVYTEATNGTHTVHYNTTDSDGISSYVQSGVGNDILSVGIILTNLAESGSINYSVKVTLLPSESSLSISTSSRYMERGGYIDAGGCVEYKTTFSNSGKKVFQTFGSKDTKIYLYDKNGALLDSDDDSGYNLNGFLYYNVVQGTEYTIKVTFYSSSETGEVKLAIMPAMPMSPSTYEGIFVCDEKTMSYAGILSQYQVRLLRYNSTKTKTVTFTTEADFDMYLYVIDPRSTLPISSSASQPSTYNDDGAGNLQAKITKRIEANVPYLIIASAYNPSTQWGAYKILFD